MSDPKIQSITGSLAAYVALVIGAITTPPNPPIAAATTKLQNANVRSGIPNVDAIGGFATAARTAVPAYV